MPFLSQIETAMNQEQPLSKSPPLLTPFCPQPPPPQATGRSGASKSINKSFLAMIIPVKKNKVGQGSESVRHHLSGGDI
jgi:hypothetical protein